MSQRNELIDFALTLSHAVADCPFEDDLDTTVVRHGIDGKWFGLFMKVSGKHLGREKTARFDVLNLKIDPEESYIVREMYDAILPAYHMNKRHWISVILDGSVPNDFCEFLIGKSYDLTKPKKRSKS
ncbi:MAG: MmcQ/YjbR family DNA-binding protein [Clostridia bacterium]|nr:MmcQ/YjbR family DNA-binding protein [Clostridia bacterium]